MDDTKGTGAETQWRGKYLEVRKQGSWEWAARIGDLHAAVLLAIDGDDVLLVEQERPPLGRRSLELPAGLVGDEYDGETVASAAARELEEECGYRAAGITPLGAFASSPGMTSEMFTVVRMTGLSKVGAGGGVEGENVTVHRVALGEVAAFVDAKRAQGCAIDSKLLLLLAAGFIGGG